MLPIMMASMLIVGVASHRTVTVPQKRVVYVSASATAVGDGTMRRPFSDLNMAQQAVRAALQQKATVEVVVRGGTYTLYAPLVLGTEDSGTAENPVQWHAAKGEQVRLIGGRMLTNWQAVTDPKVLAKLDPTARPHIRALDLRSLGITDYGDPSGGFGREGDTGLELFLDDVPMTLARYPNDGFVRITGVAGPTPMDGQGQKATKEGVVQVQEPRLSRWADEKDIRVNGYWFFDWADLRQKVVSLDPATGTVRLGEPWADYGYRTGQYFYFFNLLSEIDRPGEWYLDREAGRLYVWPPNDRDPKRAMVSLLPAVLRIEGAKHIQLRGFTIEGARHDGVDISASEAVQLIGCTIRNCGNWAVRINGGTNCSVRGCEMTLLGEGGVSMEGGDRATLTPAGHTVENCHIHHYSRWTRTYKPGIQMNGVGCRAIRNLIHDAPHMGIGLSGNEHQVIGNEVHNVCEETNDAGALYAGRDWAARGQVIQGNWFHHIYGFEGKGANGVYLDDQFSSASIANNLFESVERAIHLGGGRDHQVRNNLFVDCPNALHIDARGLGWRAYGFEELKRTLEAQPYRQSPWKERYPTLLTLLDDHPMAPVGIVVERNVIIGDRWNDIEEAAKPYLTLRDNLFGLKPDAFRQKGTFPMLTDTVGKEIGFVPLATGRMGLYRSEDRASWPVIHPVTIREWHR